MSKDLLITLIKEVVKNEVKRQVKEELIKMAKSGAVTFNTKPNKPSVIEHTSTDTAKVKVHEPMRKYSKDPMLNEILNSTSPFSAQQRSSGGGLSEMMGGSVLDMIQRDSDDDWGTIKMTSNNFGVEPTPQPTVESTGNESLDILNKALNRDYTELVKRFK